MKKISAKKFDVDGREIFIGDILEATYFNGSQYTAILEVVIDPRDGEACLKMIKGNEIAMKNNNCEFPYQSFPSENEKGFLRKGRIINR